MPVNQGEFEASKTGRYIHADNSYHSVLSIGEFSAGGIYTVHMERVMKIVYRTECQNLPTFSNGFSLKLLIISTLVTMELA